MAPGWAGSADGFGALFKKSQAGEKEVLTTM